MNKLISLLLAGITVSMLITGCNKPEEGDNANAPATTAGKMNSTTPPKTSGTDAGGTGDTKATGSTAGTPPPNSVGGATAGK